jgi:formate/nitrite transporter
MHTDAYSPLQIAERVEAAAVRKAALTWWQTALLAALAGAFIALGAMFFIVVVSDSALGYGPTRVLGGLCFSLGLVLVIVGGAELFTGNNLMTMAWVDGRIGTADLAGNWLLAYAFNFVGALLMAVLLIGSGVYAAEPGLLGSTAIGIANSKLALTPELAFYRGVLCNVLVCLAVWLTFAAHTVSGKILAIVFPITAFVALGFEHSVANMFFIPLGLILSAEPVNWSQVVVNFASVTLGNVVGGGVLVALVYWGAYRSSSGSGLQ